jgi:replication factor C large subunit
MAKKYDMEIFELNASDSRSKKSIEESLGDVIRQSSLFQKQKLLLIDEIDGLAGREDRGGAATLAKIIKNSPYPIVLTANDVESENIKLVKKVSIEINFENHSRDLLLNIAKKIFKEEKIKYSQNDLSNFLENRFTIDIRAFINDLQSSVFNSIFSINENIEIRDYKKELDEFLYKIFLSYPEDSFKSSFNTRISLEDLFLYLEENVPNSYSKYSLILALNEISKADIFNGRIRRRQYWRFLVYVNFYLTYGVSSAKTTPKKKEIKKNSRFLKTWIYSNKVNGLKSRTKIQKQKKEEVPFIENYSKLIKRSVNKARSDDIKYFSIIYNHDENFRNKAKNI